MGRGLDQLAVAASLRLTTRAIMVLDRETRTHQAKVSSRSGSKTFSRIFRRISSILQMRKARKRRRTKDLSVSVKLLLPTRSIASRLR
jgi:hypothetical protein